MFIAQFIQPKVKEKRIIEIVFFLINQRHMLNMNITDRNIKDRYPPKIIPRIIPIVIGSNGMLESEVFII